MDYSNIRFINSLLYFHMPLSALPRAYGLPHISKGNFCHLFNTPENANYVGALPPMEMFAPDLMSSKDRDSFLSWYNERGESGEEFNLKQEMMSYCSDDVEILRQSSRIFRNMYLHEFDIDPFVECLTIFPTCMRVYEKNFLKEE